MNQEKAAKILERIDSLRELTFKKLDTLRQLEINICLEQAGKMTAYEYEELKARIYKKFRKSS